MLKELVSLYQKGFVILHFIIMPTELIYLIIGLLVGIIFWLYSRSQSVPKSLLENSQLKLTQSELQLALLQERNQKLGIEFDATKKEIEFFKKNNSDLIQENATLNANIEKLEAFLSQMKITIDEEKKTNILQQEELNRLTKWASETKANNTYLEDKLNNQKQEIEDIRKKSNLEFENLANRILEEKVNKFTQSNKDNIDQILKPLGENLSQFKKKVEETYDIESKQRFSLEERVKELINHSNRISTEANNLTNALKGQSKKQGNWGEIILESILEKSGLQKNREYQIQFTGHNEDGQILRPDVLVFLPDERTIIIDSKVSLNAYERYCSADTKDEQDLNLGLHLKSIYQHIDELSKKRYDELSKELDFIMMFIPIEPAYMLASQEDPELWNYAYQRRILLISPTNLIASLKLITDLWKRDQQSKNAIEIARQGEKLYEKVIGFFETMDDIEKHLNKSQEVFLKAKRQLRDGKGNIVGQALKLKNMGIQSEKSIPAQFLPTDLEDNDEPEEG
ncbi:MAG: DNA recombination protein RmuC [Saprospiraceae bacterium]|nr:DNA recombination protein RmuC [Saprospiraceae bacterium]